MQSDTAIGTQPVVVTADADSDVLIGFSTKRYQFVYPRMINAFKLVQFEHFNESTDRAALVQTACLNPSVQYITGSGHGTNSAFLGYNRETIFSSNNYTKGAVQNKIIHFLACRAATSLGPNMVENGATAFFGYNVPFAADLGFLKHFVVADGTIDISLAAGNTVEETYNKTIAVYLATIKKIEHLNPRAANWMRKNMEALNCPVNNPKLGDRQARLHIT